MAPPLGRPQVRESNTSFPSLPYLPSNAGSAVYSARPDPTALSPGTGLLVLVIWVVVALAVAALLLTRRDA